MPKPPHLFFKPVPFFKVYGPEGHKTTPFLGKGTITCRVVQQGFFAVDKYTGI